MIEFTTSKGEFIAVPVPDPLRKVYPVETRPMLDGCEVTVGDYGSFELNGYMKIEVIGLSSDILKDEELAKKVVYDASWSEQFEKPCDSVKSFFTAHNITGNNLIIKKK